MLNGPGQNQRGMISLSRLQNAGQTGEFTIARRPFKNQQVLEPVSSTRQCRFTRAAIQIDRGIDSPHASTRNGSSFCRPIANRIAQASPALSTLAASAPPPELPSSSKTENYAQNSPPLTSSVQPVRSGKEEK